MESETNGSSSEEQRTMEVKKSATNNDHQEGSLPKDPACAQHVVVNAEKNSEGQPTACTSSEEVRPVVGMFRSPDSPERESSWQEDEEEYEAQMNLLKWVVLRNNYRIWQYTVVFFV